MEKIACPLYRFDKQYIAYPATRINTAPFDIIAKTIPNSTKHYNATIAFPSQRKHSPNDIKHVSSQISIPTYKTIVKAKPTTISSSPKHTNECNIKERYSELDKISKISSTKSSSNISQSKKESQNASSFWSTENKREPISKDCKRKHFKSQLSMEGPPLFHYVPSNYNMLLSKIHDTMKPGCKINLNNIRQPAMSMPSIKLPSDDSQISTELERLKARMLSTLSQSKHREQKMLSIIRTLTSQLNDALLKISAYEQSMK